MFNKQMTTLVLFLTVVSSANANLLKDFIEDVPTFPGVPKPSEVDECVKNPRKCLDPRTNPTLQRYGVEDIHEGSDGVITMLKLPFKELKDSATAIAAIEIAAYAEVSEHFGDDAARAIAQARFPHFFSASKIETTATAALEAIDDPSQLKNILGLPLREHLEQAYLYYKPDATQIPLKVRQDLALKHFDPEFLKRCYYVVSALDPTLPALLNTINTFGETFESKRFDANGNAISTVKNHAVAIKDLIIFETFPGTDDTEFWAHEVHHLVQYARWGTAGFASKYVEDYRAVEKEADDAASLAAETAKLFYEEEKEVVDRLMRLAQQRINRENAK